MGISLYWATSTLSRINLKPAFMPRKRIKCSPSTLSFSKRLRQREYGCCHVSVFKKFCFVDHTNTPSSRFQIDPLWRAFSKSSVFGHRKRFVSVDGRPIRRRKKKVIKKITRLSVDVASDIKGLYITWNFMY